MAGSLNKVTLIGNLGNDPEVRCMQNGGEVANLSVATTESWKDKNTGERRDKTEWHRVAIFSPGLVGVAKNYLRKGSKVYLEGQLETRKWQDQSGQDRYTTEIVLKNYNSSLIMLDGRNSGGGQMGDQMSNGPQDNYAPGAPSGGMGMGGGAAAASAPIDELEDEIPF